MEWPLSSWKYLVAIALGAPRNGGLISGLVVSVGSLKVLLPQFFSMSCLHSWVALEVDLRLRKESHTRAATLLPSRYVTPDSAASLAY